MPAVEHFQFLGYLVVLLVAFFESIAFIGIAIPGSTFVIFIGFISSGGFLDLGDVVWFAAIGAIIGDTLSYYLGSNVDRFFKKDNKIFKSKYLEKGKTFFGKYGGRSIFLGRFIGPIRPIIPFVAGMFKMKIRNFFLWDIFSSFAWATAFLLIGFFFGQAWETIVLWSERSSLLIAGLVFFIVVFYILDRFVIKRGKRVLRFLVSVLRSIKHAVIYNHDVKRILNKHPVFFRFIRMRFNKSNFFGLPTTLLLFAF
ncbi:MAG: DedA family protein, partial [Candidatus Scalindua sp.]